MVHIIIISPDHRGKVLEKKCAYREIDRFWQATAYLWYLEWLTFCQFNTFMFFPFTFSKLGEKSALSLKKSVTFYIYILWGAMLWVSVKEGRLIVLVTHLVDRVNYCSSLNVFWRNFQLCGRGVVFQTVCAVCSQN